MNIRLVKRAAVYARISKADSDVDKVENQVSELKNLAESNGYEIVAVHTDDDISAFTGSSSRSGYMSLIDGLQARAYDVVLATEPQRLTRGSATDLDLLQAHCVKAGAFIHARSAGVQDPATPTTKALMNKPRLFVTGLALLALVLSGCSSPDRLSPEGDETPEVTLEEPTKDTVAGAAVSAEGDITLMQIIEGEDVERRALVITPGDYDPTQAYPVVLGFHGNGQSPEDFAWFVESVCSYEPQCIAVVPEGYKRSWNLGVEESTADDVAFVTDLVDELSTRYPLTSDFFALGHSNGSGLVHVLATEAALFKGVAGYGSMLIEGREPQAGTSPVSVLQVHGMQDDVIPYAGGDSPVGLRFVPVEESAALWAGVNDCDASTSQALDNGGLMLSFEGCVDDHRVIHYGLADQGHDAGMSEEFAHVTSEFFASLP